MTQLQLHLTGPHVSKSPSPGKLAARMMAVLAVNRGWVTRKQFACDHGFSRDGRQCRLGREASHGRIIMGQHGYKLLRYATAEEVRICDMTYRSQIEALTKERLQLQRRAHRQLHERGVA